MPEFATELHGYLEVSSLIEVQNCDFLSVAVGVSDYKRFIKDDETIAQESQQAQQAQLGQNVAPHVVNAAGKLMQEGMKQNAGSQAGAEAGAA